MAGGRGHLQAGSQRLYTTVRMAVNVVTDRPAITQPGVHGARWSIQSAWCQASCHRAVVYVSRGFASTSAHRWLVDMRSNAFPVTKARRHIIAVFILSYIGPPSSSILQYSFPF